MKVLDLFSGIGGFSLGLERAGFSTLAFCEIDPHARKVLKKHWPDTPIFEDVTKLKAKDLSEMPQVICGGFPCQDVSVAGKKKGLEHEGKRTRSGLWEEFKRLIKEIEPRYVIIENVANLRNLGLNQVIKDLWSVGYDCEWHIISARSVGACHLRERIWIIAYPRCGFGRASNKRDSKEFRGRSSNGEGVGSQDALEIERPSVRRPATTGRVEYVKPTNSNSTRCQEQQWAKSEEQKISTIELRSDDPADSHLPRLWKPFTSEKEKSEWWAKATSSFRSWWEIESTICRVDDGLPEESHEDNSNIGMEQPRIDALNDLIARGRVTANLETGEIISLVKNKVLKGCDLKGYITHKLVDGGNRYSFKAHQIVMAVAGELCAGKVIDHKNRDKKDNRLCNLRMVDAKTNSQNQDRSHIGLSEEEKHEIAEIYFYTDISIRELAEEIGISKSRVHQVIKEIKLEKHRRERIKQLGNSVVPQIPELIGRCIMEYEGIKPDEDFL